MEQSIKLEPIPIGELLGKSFFIPDYQRGYRWTKTQVNQLLDDIWEFTIDPPEHKKGEEKPFYCLQPLVVKNRNDNEWEVIDGQQRLTTLYLILKTLEPQIGSDQKNFEKISYETRIATDKASIGSEEFLKNVEYEQYQKYTEDNIDFYHIGAAYQTIQKWFKTKANETQYKTPAAKIAPTLLEDTKVIWYKVEEAENESLIDIFTRLNDGKIPLTNAELIKALFLQKRNFVDNEVDLKQIQIASEWDTIEKTLQDDDFWFFIYNPENPLKYDNRIEYIFDLMTGRTKDSGYYYAYDGFYNLMNGIANDTKEYKIFNEIYKNIFIKDDKKPKIENVWLEIKKYFLTFEEWFKDNELFHYVGFLINDDKDINKIKENSSNKTKTEFKEYLKSEIWKQIEINDIDDIDSLEYDDRIKTKKVLLLFNIQTVLQTQKSDMRFSFRKFKLEKWDIEHVRSQTDKVLKDEKDRKAWIKDILEYFTGVEIKKIEQEEIDKLKEKMSKLKQDDKLDKEEQTLCNSLIELLLSSKIEEILFNDSYKQMEKLFKESEPLENIDNISNLALLDATTNRSYKNAFFPIKRKRIITNDKNGIFVPICTKNLFLKYYSKKLNEVMHWDENDATDYIEAIKETLKELKKKEDKQ